MDWRMTEAKKKFSELMNRALTEGPQRVQRVRGRQDAVIMLAEEEYERLAGKRIGFKEFLMLPVGLEELDLSRDQSPIRDVDL